MSANSTAKNRRRVISTGGAPLISPFAFVESTPRFMTAATCDPQIDGKDCPRNDFGDVRLRRQAISQWIVIPT
jgi:hypothetical protein